MNISSIGSSNGGFSSLLKAGDEAEGGGFGQVLDNLSAAAAGADQAMVDVAVGADTDLHDVVLAVEMESLAFDLAVQIRNRLVEMYQEVSRMQI